MTSTLQGRVAVVTGGSRGIGRAVCLALAQQGAVVVVNYHKNAEAAQAVVAEISAQGGQAAALQADVSQLAAAEGLIKGAVDQFGKIDILVNNAGITRDNLIMRMKEEDWDAVLDNNLKGAWNCCKAASQAMMRKRYGRIINISSVVGLTGQGGQTNYAASKAGLIGLTKALARELASRSITVNAIAPGFIETDMTANTPPEMLEELKKRIPLERWGKAEDVAYGVAFFAAEAASYITGQVLAIDGGLVM
jgi:3-oxoacyl-[acyl-carrier protein] reductase